jgi:ubiquinone/menaquinone biosynthesis C-methylase UbiE
LTLGSAAWKRHDIGQPMLWIWGDARDLPFQDSSFTHYHSFVTLSYVPVQRALREAARVLVPGGRLIITVEGLAYLHERSEKTKGLRACVAGLRERLAFSLTSTVGAGWQTTPLFRKLSQLTLFTPEGLQRVVRQAGFAVEKCVLLLERKGVPRLIALTATKSGRG